MRNVLCLVLLCFVWLTSNAATPICGRPEVDVERMYRFVKMHNPEFPREIAEAYYKEIPEHITEGVIKRLPDEFIDIMQRFYGKFIEK